MKGGRKWKYNILIKKNNTIYFGNNLSKYALIFILEIWK